MKSLRMLILWVACGAASTPDVLWAAEQAPAKPETPAATPAATEAPAKPADESAAPKSDEDSKDEAKDPAKDPGSQEPVAKPKPAATTADKKGSSPQRFVPSEQVRADFDVSFPIDI